LVAAVACPVRVDFSVGPFTTLSALDVVLLICAVYFLLRFLAFVPVTFGPPLIAIAVLTPAVLAVMSILWTVDATLTAAAAIKYLYTVLIYFVALQFGANLSYTQFIRAIVVILFGWLLGSLAMYVGVPGFAFFLPQSLGFSEPEVLSLLASLYTRLGHPYVGQSNDYGPLLALLGFLLLGCARVRDSCLLFVASALAFVSSTLTLSRGLMAALLISLSLYALISRVPPRRIASIAVSGAVLAGLLALALGASEISVVLDDREINIADIVESRLSDVNLTIRVEGYQEILSLISDRPWLGYGAGYYDRTYPDAFVAAHNAYLEQWKYFGTLLGTLSNACYLAMAIYFFGLRRDFHESPFIDAVACAWVCLLAAALVETFFEAPTPRAVIYFVLGLCISVPRPNGPEAVRSRPSRDDLNHRT